ncbi:MAG: twin-arginine translocation pathway signal [Bryobacterales bacterium]|nr:twin-arginine translocation pathway signal [Bryobacterales bacterium]
MKPITALFALAALVLAEPTSDKSLGNPNAPVKIDVFSDFQCPACKALHDQTLPDLINDEVNKGRVLLVYHDFPLPQHSHAREAARWANAASRVHKYREVSDALFRTQLAWEANGDVRSVVAGVLNPAEMKTVEALMKDPKFDDGIAKDVALGQQAGLRQTPTLIVTHKLQTYPFGGFISYSILKPAIDDIAKK